MTASRRRATRWLLAGLVAFTVGSVLIGVAIGPVFIPIRRILASLLGHEVGGLSPIQEVILWQIRLPRVLLGLLVGGGLAVSGVAMQGLFRNPLASPYVLGVATYPCTQALPTCLEDDNADKATLCPNILYHGLHDTLSSLELERYKVGPLCRVLNLYFQASRRIIDKGSKERPFKLCYF